MIANKGMDWDFPHKGKCNATLDMWPQFDFEPLNLFLDMDYSKRFGVEVTKPAILPKFGFGFRLLTIVCTMLILIPALNPVSCRHSGSISLFFS